MEDAVNADPIAVISQFDAKMLQGSMFSISADADAYDAICRREHGIRTRTVSSCGTREQWFKLLEQIVAEGSFAKLVTIKLGAPTQLATNFVDFVNESDELQFLCFIALKVYCADGGGYLGECVRKSNTFADLLPNIYNGILDIQHTDPQFGLMIKERRRILQALEGNETLQMEFCRKAFRHKKDILYYLSENSAAERKAIIEALAGYDYTDGELDTLLPKASPMLAAYMKTFRFDEFNTKTLESERELHPYLTQYFNRYKRQKLTNRNDDAFIAIVEEEAVRRSFMKVPARGSIVKKMDKAKASPYFFDALGVEFLAFIQSRCEVYGIQFDCRIAHCELPSITSRNKEFYEMFPANTICKEERLDEIKHHGTIYNYETVKEPLHLFAELDLLDQSIHSFANKLNHGGATKIIILSDHGASRLAVTYRSENEKLVLEEKGEHSGRCCPAAEDPGIEFATYEGGYAVLANYERFKGGRRAEVEAHGGATLEEVLVPIITLTKIPNAQMADFNEEKVKCSVDEGVTLHMTVDPPLEAPRLVVNGVSAIGAFEGSKHNIVFRLPEIKRKGNYDAELYDGSRKIKTLTFEAVRATRTVDLF